MYIHIHIHIYIYVITCTYIYIFHTYIYIYRDLYIYIYMTGPWNLWRMLSNYERMVLEIPKPEKKYREALVVFSTETAKCSAKNGRCWTEPDAKLGRKRKNRFPMAAWLSRYGILPGKLKWSYWGNNHPLVQDFGLMVEVAFTKLLWMVAKSYTSWKRWFIPLFIGVQPSFWWCRISQPSTVAMTLGTVPGLKDDITPCLYHPRVSVENSVRFCASCMRRAAYVDYLNGLWIDHGLYMV